MFGAVLTTCVLAAPAAPLELEPGDLKPGLVAEYRSVAEPKATVARIEPKPAFTLGRSSPRPRSPPVPFEVTYTGVLQIKDTGSVTFSAFVGGELTITVDGGVVLEGRGQTDTAQIKGRPQEKLTKLSEEHATVEANTADIRIGERREVIPAHCCATMNLHRNCVAFRKGRIEALWPIEASGRYD